MQNTSPRSQVSLRDERYQVSLRDEGYQHEPLSIGALMQTSAAALENECIVLEQEIIEKVQGLKDLKEKCTRQAENISKQKLEMEHMKMKTYSEVTNRESFLSKYSNFMGKCETMEENLREWFMGLNQAMSTKNDRQQFAETMALKAEAEADQCQQLEQAYDNVRQQADNILGELKQYIGRQKTDYDNIMSELMNDCSLQSQKQKQLEEQLRNAEKECDEKALVIQVLNKQNEDAKRTFNNLTIELSDETKNLESITNQLQTKLQEELTRKANLSKELEVMGKSIHETNISLRDNELEIKALDSKHKQLISEGEAFDNKLKNHLEELNRFQADVKIQESRFYALSEIDRENKALKSKIDELNETHEIYKTGLADITGVEESLCQELEEVNELIKEKEVESDNIVKENKEIDAEIRKLREDFENISQERNKIRSEIDKRCIDLDEGHKLSMANINNLNEEMEEAIKERDQLETIKKNLKKKLDIVKTKSEEANSKLFSCMDESKLMVSGLKEDLTLVKEMVARNQQDYQDVQRAITEGEGLKVRVVQLQTELGAQHADHVQSVAELEALHREQLELKKKHLEELKVHYEAEFKSKEQKKLDAMLELKENKARIADHQKKRTLMQYEIKKTRQNIKNYDNLVQKLEEKLKNVAQVAGTVSQSVKDLSSQDSRNTFKQVQENLPPQTKRSVFSPLRVSGRRNFSEVSNLLSSSQLSKKVQKAPAEQKVIFPSPSGSSASSSGLSFDPDDIRMRMKNVRSRSKPVIQTSKPKMAQEKVPATSSKKEESDSDDAWGFNK